MLWDNAIQIATWHGFFLSMTPQFTQLYFKCDMCMAIDSSQNENEFSFRPVCDAEKSGWCTNENVCQGVKCKEL